MRFAGVIGRNLQVSFSGRRRGLRRMKARGIVLRVTRVIAFALMLISLSTATAQDVELRAETLFMTFVPNIQFAPVYVGIEHGDFADQGIDLAIEHGDEPLGVELIAAGQRRFGLISGEQVIQARANDRPVVMVYQWFQTFPIAIVTPVESGIESVADLVGRRVGVPGRFGATYSGLIALLAASGLGEADVQLEPIGFIAPEAICTGIVEAAAVYLNNEPLQIRHRAEQDDCPEASDIRVFPVASAANLVSNGIVTSEAAIVDEPDLVRGMVAGFHAGLRRVIENPAEAYLISLDAVENLPIDDVLRARLEEAAAEQNEFLTANPDAPREAIAERRAALYEMLAEEFSADLLLQFEVLLASIELWDADELGMTAPPAWETTQDTLIAMDFLDAPLDELDTAYTNTFVPTPAP